MICKIFHTKKMNNGLGPFVNRMYDGLSVKKAEKLFKELVLEGGEVTLNYYDNLELVETKTHGK